MYLKSSSSARTEELGRRAGRALAWRGIGRRARVLLLRGELGSGKTTFMRGFARGLGARGRVASPTFIIVRRMPVARGPFINLFHIDAYRLSSGANTRVLGILDALHDPQNVLAVEWPDAVRNAFPRGALTVRFAHGARWTERSIHLPKQLT